MATAVYTDKTWIAALGPLKMEVVPMTAVTDADTYTSRIASPQYGFFVITTDGGALTAAVNVSISGRTVTLNSVDLSSSAGILVLFGE